MPSGHIVKALGGGGGKGTTQAAVSLETMLNLKLPNATPPLPPTLTARGETSGKGTS
mgnify:CR=1 FL=1